MTNSVMVVDDDEDIRETIGLVIRLDGFEVSTAKNGREALDRLVAGERPSLIILDLMMPGMNGSEFRAEQLRNPGLAGIPVVVLSGDGHVSDKAAAIGLTGMAKPLDLSDLLAVVHTSCHA